MEERCCGKKELELYFHIPFCVRKCFYCDFLSAPGDEKVKRDYMEALLTETVGSAFRYADYEDGQGKYQLNQLNTVAEGTFKANDKGFGFVKFDDESMEDAFIDKHNTKFAIDGDHVKVKIIAGANPWNGRGPEGKIEEITERGVETHRDRRSKSQIVSQLDSIKGIGPATSAALMKHFRSIKKLKEASLDEIAGVIGKSKAELIRRNFDNKQSN